MGWYTFYVHPLSEDDRIKERKRMKKKISEYRLVLVDMDGTLYYQRPLQITMGLWMIKNAVSTKEGLQELMTVLKYRRMREHFKEAEDIETKLFQALADEQKMSLMQAERIIQKWIYELPLSCLPRFKDEELIKRLQFLKEKGIRTVIYSDYPTTEKQKALEITDFAGFFGGQKEIDALKPNPEGIFYIMNRYAVLDARDVLMIGDRKSKDGQAAISADVDYLILKKNKYSRKKQYKNLPL